MAKSQVIVATLFASPR